MLEYEHPTLGAQVADWVGPTAMTVPFFRVQTTLWVKLFQELQTPLALRYSALDFGKGRSDHQPPILPAGEFSLQANRTLAGSPFIAIASRLDV